MPSFCIVLTIQLDKNSIKSPSSGLLIDYFSAVSAH